MIPLIPAVIFVSLLVFACGMYILDVQKKRKPSFFPLVSFIVPVWNEEKTIEKTIKAIRSAYPKSKSELLIINDASTDNTLQVLKKLKKEFKFTLINHKKNKGKVSSVNEASNLAKGEIIFSVDAETIISKKAVYDVITRFENKKIGAISCRHKPIEKSFLSSMQELEYNMFAIIQASYNLTSTLYLWGSCMAFRKKAFNEIGMLSESAIIEDQDAALKLNEKGWKVQQSSVPVHTNVPQNIKSFYKQKVRWASGCAQCIMNHKKAYLKNPMSVFFMMSYMFIILFSIVAIVHAIPYVLNAYHFMSYMHLAGFSTLTEVKYLDNIYKPQLNGFLSFVTLSSMFSIPYTLLNVKKPKHAYNIFWAIPFSIVYFPIYSAISVVGFAVGIYKYPKLKKGERGWYPDGYKVESEKLINSDIVTN